jgi:hypothetical protein
MSSQFRINPDALKEAVAILQQIPADMDPGGGASVSGLDDALKGAAEGMVKFASYGDDQNSLGTRFGTWISGVAQAVSAHVSDVSSACSSLGSAMDSTIKSYEAADQTNASAFPGPPTGSGTGTSAMGV